MTSTNDHLWYTVSHEALAHASLLCDWFHLSYTLPINTAFNLALAAQQEKLQIRTGSQPISTENLFPIICDRRQF